MREFDRIPLVPRPSFLPRVQHDTAIVALCDLIRNEQDCGSDEDEGILIEWQSTVALENPEVLKAVNWFLQDAGLDQKLCGLGAMAITYRTLSAQAEIAALKKIGVAPRRKSDWSDLGKRVAAWLMLVAIALLIAFLVAAPR